MKLILRNFISTLRRYSASSLLNIAGLSIAFASLYIIIAQLKYDLTFNQSIPGYENLYLVTNQGFYGEGTRSSYSSRLLIEEIALSTPLIEQSAPFEARNMVMPVTQQLKDRTVTHRLDVGRTNKTGLELLGVEIIEGSLDDFDNPTTFKSWVISQSKAKKYGIKVGDMLYYGTNTSTSNPVAPVVAIYRDVPDNVDFLQYDIITNIGDDGTKSLNMRTAAQIVRANKTVTAQDLNQKARQDMIDQIKRVMPDQVRGQDLDKNFDVEFIPLAQTHLDERIDGGFIINVGDRMIIRILIVVGALILIIALINFVNFFFALVPMRIKTVNTFKIFGCSKGQLRVNFISETIGLVIVSLSVAVLLVALCEDSPIAHYVTAPFEFSRNLTAVALTVTIAFVMAILTSIYPTIYITSFSPMFTIKGRFGATSRGRALRYTLITVQMIISFMLICCVTFIKTQHSFMLTRNAGFDSQGVLSITLPQSLWEASKGDRVYEQLKNDPRIKDAMRTSSGIIVELSGMISSYSSEETGTSVTLQIWSADHGFLDFMDVEIVAGRNIRETDSVNYNIINETAYKQIGLDINDPKIREAHSVIGVFKDFNFQPLTKRIEPLAIRQLQPYYSIIYIRLNDIEQRYQVEDAVKGMMLNVVPDCDVETSVFKTYNEEVAMLYAKEDNLTQLIGLFTVISIAISLIGIFGLVLFDTSHRTQEITVRRIHGATIGGILWMINRSYLRLTLIAFVVAAPLSYQIITGWLEQYEYRTPIHLWIFGVILILVALLVVAVVTIRSYRTASANPTIQIRKNN